MPRTISGKSSSKDGLVSFYGTPAARSEDPAVVANPNQKDHVFAWKLTETRDPFGNRIVYEYEQGEHSPQLYLRRIRYVDYMGEDGQTHFLVSVTFEYEDRPDPFAVGRPGFLLRTTRRCRRIEVKTHPRGTELARFYEMDIDDPELPDQILVRSYDLGYDNESRSGVSLLRKITVTGHDREEAESFPPLMFDYSRFQPEARDFFPVKGVLPPRTLGSPDLTLVDLFGNGLPDIVQINGTVRYWRNMGEGRFALPRSMSQAPAGLSLAEPGV
jgi:hypothetical protein